MSEMSITAAPVAVRDGKVITTSLKIAETFGRLHKDVLRAIETLEVPAEWYERNFALIQNPVDLGMGRTRMDKAYSITRDGFTILAMGFTGKAAMQFKIAYIEAFNAMEAHLRGEAERPLFTSHKLITGVEAARQIFDFVNACESEVSK